MEARLGHHCGWRTPCAAPGAERVAYARLPRWSIATTDVPGPCPAFLGRQQDEQETLCNVGRAGHTWAGPQGQDGQRRQKHYRSIVPRRDQRGRRQEPGQTDRNASRGGQRAGGQQGGRSERIFQCSGPSPHKDHRRNGNEHRQQNDGARANVAGTLRVPYAWNVFPARNVLHYRQDWQTSPTMRLLLWQTAHGVCRLLRRGGQFGGAVGLLPSEVGVAAAKMPARGRLAVNGPAEIEILDDPAGR